MELTLGLVIGLIVGGVTGLLVYLLVVKPKSAEEVVRVKSEEALTNERLQNEVETREQLEAEVDSLRVKSEERGNNVARLQAQLSDANERNAEQADIKKALSEKFNTMAFEVMAKNNERFFTVADEKIGTLVKPLSEELKRIETARTENQGSLKQQLEDLAANNQALQQEARNLSTALKAPQVRGRWGEIQLRRVVELAGMSNYCDYEEQVSIQSSDGKTDRPDMVVRMPSDRTIVVDAKTPLNGYIESVESKSDDERDAALARHASQVRERAQDLSRKAYWDSLERSPEFVVMFMPGEFFLQPALERDPQLMEWALEQKVVIATPNTLMVLLKTVYMGWSEVKLAEKAKEIAKLGRELHDRLYTLANHMSSTRRSLSATVDHFNKSIGSLENNALPSARKFKELGVSSNREIAEIKLINTPIRQLQSLPTQSDDR